MLSQSPSRQGNLDESPGADLVVVNRGETSFVTTDPFLNTKNGDESFQVLSNDGNGKFTAAPEITVPGDNPNDVAVADFNTDGNLDIAILQPTPNRPSTAIGDVALFLGDGIGGFIDDGNYRPVGAQPTAMTVADYSGDGIPDVAVSNFCLSFHLHPDRQSN